jgi:hypothetical protein
MADRARADGGQVGAGTVRMRRALIELVGRDDSFFTAAVDGSKVVGLAHGNVEPEEPWSLFTSCLSIAAAALAPCS